MQSYQTPSRHILKSPRSKYIYTESPAYRLIIKHLSEYSLDMTKYRPNNPITAWRSILNQQDENFVQSWFCFQFPIIIKERKVSKTLKQHQHKLHQKLQREFTLKIRDITYYLTKSLRIFKRAKKRRGEGELKAFKSALVRYQ